MTGAPRQPRADALRNSERIVRAAREVWVESGPNAPLEEVARRAGLGIATLYRRFPDKAELVRAAMDQGFTEQLAPVIQRALDDEDPYRGLVSVIEKTLSLAVSERNILAAARDAGALTAEATAPFVDSLTVVACRAQRAGLVREDLVPEDILRIVVMLVSVLRTMTPDGEGWRRYLALVLDALAPGTGRPLPPAPPLLSGRNGFAALAMPEPGGRS
jgi:AcrR family transcriptional regulator